MFTASVVLDSVNPVGVRLTTIEATYPRIIHSELMTHRVFSRNAASSRAVPAYKNLDRVREDPFDPVWWGKEQSGMSGREELTGHDLEYAKLLWASAREAAYQHARCLIKAGLHKSLVNRILEPFSWITVIISSTEWINFFNQRCHPDAQPEFEKVAQMMRKVYDASTPEFRDWHTPYIQPDEEFDLSDRIKISIGRCARVSYLNHHGVRDPDDDLKLYQRLVSAAPKHWSPLEHVAQAMQTGSRSGNFTGWKQWRKTFSEEKECSSVALYSQ